MRGKPAKPTTKRHWWVLGSFSAGTHSLRLANITFLPYANIAMHSISKQICFNEAVVRAFEREKVQRPCSPCDDARPEEMPSLRIRPLRVL